MQTSGKHVKTVVCAMNDMFHSYSPGRVCFEWYLLNCFNVKEREGGRRR
jgi:hypothetical protein